jgi:flagellar biosynthesis chaperone FliJ
MASLEQIEAGIARILGEVRDVFVDLQNQQAACQRQIVALQEQIQKLHSEHRLKQKAIEEINNVHAAAIKDTKAERILEERKLAECCQRLEKLFAA